MSAELLKEERSWKGDVRARALEPVKHTPGESGHLLRATATRRRAYGGARGLVERHSNRPRKVCFRENVAG